MTHPPTIVHNLALGRERNADRPLLITESGTASYETFAELVEGAVDRLTAEGVRPGDRLAVCLHNGLEVAVAIWACARAGFIFVGLPTNLAPAGWQALVAHAEPAILLAHPEYLARLPAPARPVEDLLTEMRLPWRTDVALPSTDDVYALIYTSGTTGLPKAVTVNHRATMYVAEFYRNMLELTANDVTAIHLPFSYVSGHISQLNPMMLAGGSAVTMPGFSARELIRVAHDNAVTVLDQVPWMLSRLLHEETFSPAVLPHLRAVFFGGAPMPVEILHDLRERFPDLRLYNVYGMTETGGVITALRDDEIDRYPGTVGRPVPGAHIRVAGDGELLVRGPMVSAGYWHNPEVTAANIAGGWLHTGDSGSIDRTGHVSVHGRVVDMINRAGIKIAPEDVEQALISHPDVAEAAAFGIPDGVAVQVVAACVVAVTGAQIDLQRLRGWVRPLLLVHSRPRQIRALDDLPRNPTGKVDRGALRALFTSGDD